MRASSRLLACFIFFLLHTFGNQAQPAAGKWILLHIEKISTSAEKHIIVLADSGPRVLATRLVSNGGAINLKEVAVTYGNGQVHFESRPDGAPINLKDGERTRPIDIREESRIIERILLTIDRMAPNSAEVEIQVWVLQQSQIDNYAVQNRSLTAADNEPQFIKVPIFFGTTRERLADRAKSQRMLATFNANVGKELVLGRSVVTVPRDHKAGEISRPETDLIFTQIAFRNEDPSRDFTIAAVDVMTAETFTAEMRKQTNVSKTFHGQAFVFIHGYNVSFDDAIFRAAQISFDIGFDGPVIAFSWPSKGGVWEYKHDIDSAKASRDALRQLIEIVSDDPSITAVNIIAHSMGNEPLIDVLREQADIVSRSGTTKDFKLNEIVLAAPDVSRLIFEQSVPRFTLLAKGGVTLFCSKNDVAPSASKRIAGGLARAGEVPREGVLIVPGVESIDISDASTGFLSINHSTFADRAQLVTDMQQLFKRTTEKHPPDLRSKVYKKEGPDQRRWWQFVKN